MDWIDALDDISTGEASLEGAAVIISTGLQSLDDEAAERLYGTLRAWTWKTLESRRRDDELEGWMDIIGRVASHLEDRWHVLSLKLEGFMELLQASIMTAAVSKTIDPLQRKHVKRILSHLYHEGGRLHKRKLMEVTGLKEANLSNAMAPLRDRGWIQREVQGREVIYRLTELGREICLPIVAHEHRNPRYIEVQTAHGRPLVELLSSSIKVDNWGALYDEDFKFPSYRAVLEANGMRTLVIDDCAIVGRQEDHMGLGSAVSADAKLRVYEDADLESVDA